MQNLQTPSIFLEDLLSHINEAKKEVYVESMLFESGEVMNKLVEALVSAASRGVEIKINYDWVSQKYIHGDLSLFLIPFSSKSKYSKNLHKKNVDTIQKLAEVPNISVKEINKPNIIFSVLPYSGRNHMKIYIVDDLVWIGGINLSDGSFEVIDFMVKFNNIFLLEEIKKVFLNNFNKEKYQDFKKNIYEFILMIDGGKKGKSLIYDHALEIISGAQNKIIFMSQFVPDGKILNKILEKGKEDVFINVLTSISRNEIFTTYPERLSYLNFLRKIKKFPNIKLSHLEKNVHSKLILVDGKTAIFGSHNFVIPGVLLGTREIAIETSEAGLISQINDYLSEYLAFDNE